MYIKEIIDPLNLIYYEYDSKKDTLIKDANYSNKYVQKEFFKLTYYLTQQNISFNVLKDKSIRFSEAHFDVKSYFLDIIENIQNKNKNIFLLNDTKIKWAKNIPIFNINYRKEYIDLDSYDALIFTSKNAIKAIDSINKRWKDIPSYVISEQTAKLVKDLNGNLKFFSKKKYGDAFAYEIFSELQDKKVLYLRGNELVSDLINILQKNKVLCEDEIVYENIFNQSINKVKIPKNSKIIFTSPSTIKYFFKVFTWDKSYTAISIGKTTAQYFPNNIQPLIADNPSFKDCVNKALEIK